MFDERGFDEVTVDDIVSAADVSHRTFYRYFPSKEDVLFGDATEKLEAFRGAIVGRPDGEPVFDALRRAALEQAITYEEEYGTDLRRLRIVRQTPSLTHRLAERQVAWEVALTPIVAEALELDHETDPRPRLVAIGTIGAMRAATDRWVALGGDPSLRELVDESFELLATGFREIGPA
jgi:AcrR family transcriptional regulator